ncbi:MAG: hypothetical protein R3E68_02490 [Burkholderiaceae bacterium]
MTRFFDGTDDPISNVVRTQGWDSDRSQQPRQSRFLSVGSVESRNLTFSDVTWKTDISPSGDTVLDAFQRGGDRITDAIRLLSKGLQSQAPTTPTALGSTTLRQTATGWRLARSLMQTPYSSGYQRADPLCSSRQLQRHGWRSDFPRVGPVIWHEWPASVDTSTNGGDSAFSVADYTASLWPSSDSIDDAADSL